MTKLKVFYLFALACGIFLIQDWRALAALAMLQGLLWVSAGLGAAPLWQAARRLKWFFLLVAVSYLLIPPVTGEPDLSLDLGLFTLNAYYSGLATAALMLSRVALLIATSLWVRLSASPEGFIEALRSFGMPQTVAIVIEAGLSLASEPGKNKKTAGGGQGHGKGRGEGHGRGRKRDRAKVFFADLKKGNFGFFDDLTGKAMKRSQDFLARRYPDIDSRLRHDAAIILSVVVAVMALKLLQLLPGLPLAPGHKNIVIIPLLLMATLSTHSRFGGFAAGVSVGFVSFLMGYGKFGVFEILHFAVPGLVADLMAPLLVSGSGLWLLVRLALLGTLIGFTRFAANLMILLLVGAPELAVVAFIPMLVSQMVFGGLSSLLCVYVVKQYRANKLVAEENSISQREKHV